MHLTIPFLALTLGLLPCVLQAQERVAGGSLQTEASWSALKSMVERTDGNVAVLKIDVDAMKACAAQGKIWQPGKGCIFPAADNSLYDKIVACGKLGKVYGPGTAGADANGCKTPAGTPTTPALYWTEYATEVSCPTGYKVINCHADFKTYGGTINDTKMMEPIYTANGCRGRTDSAEFGRDNPQTRSFTAHVRALCMK